MIECCEVTAVSYEIVPFHPSLASYFESLNREWIEKWFTVEAKDQMYFDDPHGTIIETGGQIFFLLEHGMPVGVAAAIRHDDRTIELAKMAVSPKCQGRGYGRVLAEAVLRFAREAAARQAIVLSDSRLETAVRLYEKLGFVHRPIPLDTGYARCNVYMELDIV